MSCPGPLRFPKSRRKRIPFRSPTDIDSNPHSRRSPALRKRAEAAVVRKRTVVSETRNCPNSIPARGHSRAPAISARESHCCGIRPRALCLPCDCSHTHFFCALFLSQILDKTAFRRLGKPPLQPLQVIAWSLILLAFASIFSRHENPVFLQG